MKLSRKRWLIGGLILVSLALVLAATAVPEASPAAIQDEAIQQLLPFLADPACERRPAAHPTELNGFVPDCWLVGPPASRAG